MKTYLISYDLISRASREQYSGLYSAIKSLTNEWCRPLESVWLITSMQTSFFIADILSRHIDRDDKLIVVELGRDFSWCDTPSEVENWIKLKFGSVR